MSFNDEPRQVVIIGSGPAGLTAAIYAARAALNPLVLGGVYWGGQLVLTSDVENFPGYTEGVLGPEMTKYVENSQLPPLKQSEIDEAVNFSTTMASSAAAVKSVEDASRIGDAGLWGQAWARDLHLRPGHGLDDRQSQAEAPALFTLPSHSAHSPLISTLRVPYRVLAILQM